MGRREPCCCCGKDPIEADLGNLCRFCFEHYPKVHPVTNETNPPRPEGRETRMEMNE